MLEEIKSNIEVLKQQVEELLSVPVNKIYNHQPAKRKIVEKIEEYIYNIESDIESLSEEIDSYEKDNQ